MIQEEFRHIDVPGYMVSNLGRVVSLKSSRGVKQYSNKDGYLLVPLRDSSDNQRQYKRLVHRLVAISFIGLPPTDEHEVDHIDQDKSNNTIGNLRWATKDEQQRNSPNNVYVEYKGELHILKDICSCFDSSKLYGNVLSRVNRGKGSHQQVFDISIRGLEYVG